MINIQSSQACRLTYERVVARKKLLVELASVFLVLGLLGVFLAVLVYLRG